MTALRGIRVIDVSTLFAGPLAATILGDFGAEVLKVEHPEGDPARRHGPSKDGVPLWWKSLNRNKMGVTLYLGDRAGANLFRRLADKADVIIENFRPGTLERWGLGFERLSQNNPGLILARVTGFGQMGPYSSRRAFGTLAEAMTGFAHMTGQPDGPPTLPPFGLADGVTALAVAFGISTALHSREFSGRGQVIDVAIIEPLLTLLGAQPIIYDQLGVIPQRNGNRSNNNAPRNLYPSKDGKWIAVSTSSDSVAWRVLCLVGREDVTQEPWFATGEGRARHAEELDVAVGDWIGVRTSDEVVEAFTTAGAAAAPVFDIADVFSDPQFQALESIVSVPDSDLGSVRMQNVIFRMSDTPGSVRHTAPSLGEHNHEVFGSLGLDSEDMQRLAERGVV